MDQHSQASRAVAAGLIVCATVVTAPAARAAMRAEELARAARSPIANMVSVPFQNDTNLNTGPLKKNQNILNIQPVIPFEPSRDWNLITRTIVPVMSQPALLPGDSRVAGVGATQFSAFLSPADADGMRPDFGPNWQVRGQVQLIFPK